MTKDDQLDNLIDQVEGETISDMFDFLSKEFIRLQCEQTIHLFTCLADRQRCQRQAKETGQRTETIERQKFIDQVFEQVKKSFVLNQRLMHFSLKMFSHECRSEIDTYLEDMILQSISDTADQQARDEIQEITKTMADLTDPQ